MATIYRLDNYRLIQYRKPAQVPAQTIFTPANIRFFGSVVAAFGIGFLMAR